MLFRTLLVVLHLSTVVIAQVPQPSPSLPETVVPGCLPPATNEKLMAPTSPTMAKRRSSGIRLAVSVPQPEGDLERTVIELVSETSQGTNKVDHKNTAQQFPRTASLTVDGLVPIPRPRTSPVDHSEKTRVAGLARELQHKQRQLGEIQAEIRKLAQDIAAADSPQIVVNVELFETVDDQLAAFIALMSTMGEAAPDDPADTSSNMVVEPNSFRKMLCGLAESGQLVVRSRPKLVTLSGRAARIEVGSTEGRTAFTITPRFRDNEWLIDAECEDRRNGLQRICGMSVSCKDGEAIGFQMKLGQQFLIGLIHPEVLKPRATTSRISTAIEIHHSASPLLPIPAWTFAPETAVREVQWLDLHLERAPVLR
jgi:hypothetical protein